MRWTRLLAIAGGVAGAIALTGGACTTSPTFVDDLRPAGTGGAGGAPACSVSTDCPGQEDECAHRACTHGFCAVLYTAAGVGVASQVSGDCRTNVCDGAGHVHGVTDDKDVPVDTDPCTKAACTQGVPSRVQVAAGTGCGVTGKLTCDAHGVCTGCAKGGDCGVATSCLDYTCDAAKTCVPVFAAAGESNPADQTPGNCHKSVCDGKGSSQTVVDDTNVPASGNPCVKGTCSAGSPGMADDPAGTACGAFTCDGKGNCQGCSKASDCGQDGPCVSYSCTGSKCQTAIVMAGGGTPPGKVEGDCKKPVCDGHGGVTEVPDDSNTGMNNNPCVTITCSAGSPVTTPKAKGTVCNNNLHCDGNGGCGGCVTAAECGTDSACTTFACNQGSCATNQVPQGTPLADNQPGDCQKPVCDGNGMPVQVADDADPPANNNPCTQVTCSAGAPMTQNLGAGTGCGGANHCNGAGQCVGCVAKGDCPGDTACATFSCTAGTCTQANVPAGSPLADGQAGDCKMPVCDGNGNPTVVPDDADTPPPVSQCSTPQCNAGNPGYANVAAETACGNAQKCDGSGNCVDCVADGDCGVSTKCRSELCVGHVCQTVNNDCAPCGACRICGGGLCAHDPCCSSGTTPK